MTENRPLIAGQVVGSDMLTAKELPSDQDLRIGAAMRVRDALGVDSAELASYNEEWIRSAGPCVFINETEFTGGDYVSGDAVTDWFDLPQGTVPYPNLMRNVRVQFEATGQYFNSGNPDQYLDFELMIDGVASGAVLSWHLTAPANNPTIVIFSAMLRAVHGGSVFEGADPTLYHLRGHLEMQDGISLATLVDQAKTARPVIDGMADRVLGFRFRRRSAVTGEAILLRSFMGIYYTFRSGA